MLIDNVIHITIRQIVLFSPIKQSISPVLTRLINFYPRRNKKIRERQPPTLTSVGCKKSRWGSLDYFTQTNVLLQWVSQI